MRTTKIIGIMAISLLLGCDKDDNGEEVSECRYEVSGLTRNCSGSDCEYYIQVRDNTDDSEERTQTDQKNWEHYIEVVNDDDVFDCFDGFK